MEAVLTSTNTTANGVFQAVTNWAVARTKSRCEKALAEFLQGRAVAHFLPLLPKRRVYGTHVRTSDIPLFAGYLFFDSDALPAGEIFDSRKVAQVLIPPDPAQLRAELNNLALALTEHGELRESCFGQPGQAVSVARGPFRGLQGELVRYSGHCRLIVRVTFIGKAAELEIDEAYLEPVR
jgi:transcription termination/antitermination protein NusG